MAIMSSMLAAVGAGEGGGGESRWVKVAAVSVPALAVWYSGSFVVKALTGYEYQPGTISHYLASQLLQYSQRRRRTRPIRVYMDGCFDMMHYGHCNALRQARACGDELVVGLVPHEEIIRCKGPPVMTEEERYDMVSTVKWVDEVLRGVPYELTEEFSKELFTKHRIDYIVHGDDPCLLPDGSDAYAHVKRLGKYKEIPRTEGVSSTDIVGRMLLMARQKRVAKDGDEEMQKIFSEGTGEGEGEGEEGVHPAKHTGLSNFLPTSRRIVQFSSKRELAANTKVVYIDGAFDMFHPGHVQILREARKLGDFLLVGLHNDDTITKHRGMHLPIMNLHERSLSVLACKHVDEVIIGAPWEITGDLLTTFNISLVVHGTSAEPNRRLPRDDPDPYMLPKKMGIFQEVKSPYDITTSTMIERILSNLEAFKRRNENKVAKEKDYYQTKKFNAGL